MTILPMRILLITVLFLLFSSAGQTELLTADVSGLLPPAAPTELGQGTNTNPKGDKITADSVSFFLNDLPWMPVAGEMHYSRYPAEQWREELLKMKAGGIQVVSTYVFWIHHEEERGRFDWSGQRSLRDFLMLCRDLDLKVIVRMGPWCHGEVRNGGFPDWVQHSKAKLRTADPSFMTMVEPLYREIARQMDGLLWKDGGPVIGVQHDNECNNVPYLLELKRLARSAGIDVPLYTMTGWNRVSIPPSELLPLFGAYSAAFWYPHSNLSFRKSFFFTDIRDDGDMGAQFVNTRPYRSENILRYPYVCCEIGGGMPSSYTKRIKVQPDEIAAMALVRLGCGSNMPGYYMYQGGINPDGKTWLNESEPNPMPVKDYDFQAPLGAFGQVREHYHLLRMQHLLIEDFGSALARMPLVLPQMRPSDLDDVSTLRWSVRSDGKGGFVFFNNYQPVLPLPDKNDIQFELKTQNGRLVFPKQAITIPSGAYGIFPFNMDCGGVAVEYATVQPLCRIESEQGQTTYFFSALEEIRPELVLNADDSQVKAISGKKETLSGRVRVYDICPGTAPTVRAAGINGSEVIFAVLTPAQGRRLWRMSVGGHARAVISNAAIFTDEGTLHLQADRPENLELAFYPSVSKIKVGSSIITGSQDGLFERFSLNAFCRPAAFRVSAVRLRDADSNAANLNGMEEASWDKAAMWKLDIPSAAADGRFILHIHYTGDAARLYVGDKLFDDNFYNGDSFDIGLWRIPSDRWSDIRLKVLPYADALLKRLPKEAAASIEAAKAAGRLDEVTVSVTQVFDLEAALP